MNTNEILKDVLEQVQEYRRQCDAECEDEPRCQNCNTVCFDSIERMITDAMTEDGQTVKKLRKLQASGKYDDATIERCIRVVKGE